MMSLWCHIGVVKMDNKLNGLPFNASEQETFEVFVTFCGLGIHNVLNYEKILLANAKQSVALEVTVCIYCTILLFIGIIIYCTILLFIGIITYCTILLFIGIIISCLSFS